MTFRSKCVRIVIMVVAIGVLIPSISTWRSVPAAFFIGLLVAAVAYVFGVLVAWYLDDAYPCRSVFWEGRPWWWPEGEDY
jgi:hypothetical protein